MRNRMLCLGMTTAVMALLAGSAWSGPGTAGAQVLQRSAGARPSGMGEAFVAAGGDIYALSVNPAGLAVLDKVEIAFLHTGGLEGLSAEHLIGAVPVPDLGVLALQALYCGQPSIDNDVPGEGPVAVKDILLGLTYAGGIIPRLRLGINAKVLILTLGPAEATTFAVDAGVQADVLDRACVGIAVRNAGQDVAFDQEADPLPMTLVAGGRYRVVEETQHQLEAALDLDYNLPEENFSVHLGGEYWFQRVLALRMGYIHSLNETVKGFSAGLGFRFQASERVHFYLDYSFLPQFWEETDFESENLVTLGIRF